MSEPEASEPVDALLRGVFAAVAVPKLSASFERRLARHVRRRELTSAGRGALAAYAVAALALSIWAMRSASLEWSLIAAAILTPAALTAATLRRRITG
jgi:hypothetical protein